MSRGRQPIPAEVRFWRFVSPEPNTGCWLWTGADNGIGHGQIGVGSVTDGSARLIYAHRLSYEMHIGQIPEGLELDHLCRVPSCVNPQHLEPVTHQINAKRGSQGNVETNPAARGQRDKTHCVNGHPLSGDNLYLHKGKRSCKECRRAATHRAAPESAARLKMRKATNPDFERRRREYQTEWARRNRASRPQAKPEGVMS